MTAPITRSAYTTGKVLSNIALTTRLYSLRIEMDSQPFIAGQFARLQLLVDGEKIAKSYSLVNPPNDPVTEVFFNTVPNGRLSNALAALKAGDSLEVSQPANGFFTIEETPEKPDLWMIATGTGLGPYLSMLHSDLAWERFERVVLVHGVAVQEELVYQDLIEQAKTAHPQQFQYLSCVTQEANPQSIEGRVTQAFSSGQLEQLSGLTINAENSAVMLCGNHAMIDDMKGLLKERGMSKHLRHKTGNIVTEQYF
uniref:ferredoxin--NADP(+) reductase n=1 Tax=uncultured Thiotrichaceae bacterium TaxID=298394 RepID=A0A6S6TMP4_9GAMM|nr:MAG: Ferredoxin--NADP(+) reductase (EC [uncultured Thiotrichaceae bacterium]